MKQFLEDSLVSKARNGDVEAFSSLYEGIYKDLYRFAFYTLRNSQEAEDAVSEAVISAFESIHKLRSADAFRRWMFQILMNKCRHIAKSNSTSNYVPIDETLPAKHSNWDDIFMVKSALTSLSEKERHIVLLTIFSGYNSKEIAKIMHVNPNTVRSIKNRSLEKLRVLMEP